jgi:protein-tyrosine phosphatase
MSRTSILFVCLGNICRSPLAEGVFRDLARQRGVEDRFRIDSAGTSAYHIGSAPDGRSAAEALRRGLELTGSARQVAAEDLREFDWVIAMDAENHAELERLHAAVGGSARLHRLREWDPEPESPDVPDPYYGGDYGFSDVHDIVERSCERLLETLLDGGASGDERTRTE